MSKEPAVAFPVACFFQPPPTNRHFDRRRRTLPPERRNLLLYPNSHPRQCCAVAVASLPHPFLPRQNLRQMQSPHTSLLPMQRPLNMHQAAIIASRTSLSPRIQNCRHLIRQHRPRNISILHCKRSPKPAALLHPRQLHEIDPAHRLQQSNRSIAKPKVPQSMTTSVIRHPMRIIGPDILQPQPLRQKLRKLKHLRQQRLDIRNQPFILKRSRHLRIMIPHHRHTRRRRHYHHLRPTKLFYKSSKQRHRLRLISSVVMHLPTTRLSRRKLHRMPQPLQHPHHGLTRLREQRVVIASNKQRDSQTNLQRKPNPEQNSIESIFPRRN
jgi:hypothetical protein